MDTDAFIHAALWEGDFAEASREWALHPELPKADLYVACVTGDFEAADRFLQAAPDFAVSKGGPRRWEPLLYVCFSAFLVRAPARRPGFLAIARRLLKLGADPNSFFIGKEEWDKPRETALYGASGLANCADLTELLLKAGADPNDGTPESPGPETVYHTAEFRDLACMRLLFQYGVSQPAKDYCLKRQLDFEAPEGTRLFLENGANPNVPIPRRPFNNALHHAILRGRSVEVIALLLEHGADPDLRNGMALSAYALASRLGRTGVADSLAARGADTMLSKSDRFLAACAAADAGAIRHLKRSDPDLVSRLAPEDHRMLALAARENRLEAARVMIEAGLNLATEDDGLQPLHWAAWFGHAGMVELLLSHHPPLEARNRYGGTPLSTAIYASRHRDSAMEGSDRADYLGVVHLLLAAGAEVHPAMLGMGAPEVDEAIETAMKDRR